MKYTTTVHILMQNQLNLNVTHDANTGRLYPRIISKITPIRWTPESLEQIESTVLEVSFCHLP